MRVYATEAVLLRWYYRLHYWVSVAGGAALTLMMLYIVCDVLLRHFLNKPLVGTTELSENVLVIATFCGITQHEITTGHVRIDLLVSRLPNTWRRAFVIVGKAVSALIFFLLTRQSFIYASDCWVNKSSSLGQLMLPVWVPVGFISVGCGLFFLHSIGGLIGDVVSLSHRKESAS